MSKIIDLSQEIFQGMPVPPALGLKTVLWYHTTHEETKSLFDKEHPFHSFATMGMILCDHASTHVDSIFHVSDEPNAQTIDQLPLEMFITEAVCLDVSNILDGYIKLADIKDSMTKHNLEIKKGDTVLLYTGHYNRNYDKKKWLTEYPGIDLEAANWLANKGVINIGIDAPSIDSTECIKTGYYPAHSVCKERKILNTENLANLDKVSGKRFTFIGLPLKIRGGTGSPIRAVAYLNNV